MPPTLQRRAHLVPAVLRAGCRLRPGVAAHQGRARRRWLEADRAEGVDVGRAAGALGCLPGAHRPRRAEAQGHHLLPGRHDLARASWSGRCGRSPATSCSTRCSSTTSSCPTRWWSAPSTTAGGWRAPRWPTSASRWRTAPRWATRWRNCSRTVAELDLDPADQDRLGALIVSAQVGSLLDQRIAQLAVGGVDPGPQASARKLIGVRYRQSARGVPDGTVRWRRTRVRRRGCTTSSTPAA